LGWDTIFLFFFSVIAASLIFKSLLDPDLILLK